MTVVIDASGIQDLASYFDRFPESAAQAMSIAINETARGSALKKTQAEVYAEVAFPQGYLDGNRLRVSKFSTPTDLEARITGRDRPTSLARFVAPGTKVVKRGQKPPPGLTVTVKPGQPKYMAGAFLVALRGGNIGLALRVKPGMKVHAVERYNPYEIFPDVYLLYGPSVDQVLTGAGEVVEPEVTSDLEAEFNRQLARFTGVVR